MFEKFMKKDTVLAFGTGRLILAVLLFFGISLAAQAQKIDENKVYDAVQYPAEPEGGYEAFQSFITTNLTYPTQSLRQRTQGTVETSFVVEKNGSITNVTIEKGLDEYCNKESLRILKMTPKWKPAKHNGAFVRQKITVPLIFKIPDSAGVASTLPQDTATTPKLKVITPELPARPEKGTEAFFQYLKQNQKYPSKAIKNQVQGKVRVEFMVEKDGSITNLKVIDKLGNGLDEEAIRLIKNGPKWLPAQYDGAPIRQKMILPVIFQL